MVLELQRCLGSCWARQALRPLNNRLISVLNFASSLLTVTDRLAPHWCTSDSRPGSNVRLIWERIAPSYDLRLTNVDALDGSRFRSLFDAFIKSDHPRQPGINEHIRGDFPSWSDEPNKTLPSPAYVTLSNWYLSSDKAYSGSERGKMAGQLWDIRFGRCRKPGVDSVTIAPGRFQSALGPTDWRSEPLSFLMKQK